MGFRFRRSLKIAPGLHLNLGKHGASASIGGRGARVTLGQKGTRTTVGIPGTGVSYSSHQPHNLNAGGVPGQPRRQPFGSC
jgi:hypothetical protein